MKKTNQVDLSSIQEKLPVAAFGLFRYWVAEVDSPHEITIKNEQNLVEDLTKSITSAVQALLRKEDLDEKPEGWDIGFIIGFTSGNLSKSWHHKYIARNSHNFKLLAGLKAIEGYLKVDELSALRINRLYEHFMESDSNLDHISKEVSQQEFNEQEFRPSDTQQTGKISAILNNLILQQSIKIANMNNDVDLPIKKYLSTWDIIQLIANNQHLSSSNE